MPDKGRAYMRKSNKKKTKRPVKKASKSTASLVKLIKSVQLKESERKYISSTHSWGTMNHDTIYNKNIISSAVSCLPPQGFGDATRIGDRIILEGIMIRAVFDIPWDRKNVKLKFFYVPYNSDQGDPTTYNNLFHNVTGNSRLDPIQMKRYKGIQYLGTYQIEREHAPFFTYDGNEGTPSSSHTSSNTGTIKLKKWIDFKNKKVFFPSDTSRQPSNLKEIGTILCLPYCSINTLTTDNVVLSGEMCVTTYFKDL